MKNLNKLGIFRVLIYIFLIILSFFWVYPFIWMVSTSFKDNNSFFSDKLGIIPDKFVLDNYKRVIENGDFGLYFINSIVVTTCVILIVLVITSLSGYILGRYNFRFKKILIATLVIGMTIPTVFTAIPIYEILKQMGISQSIFGLILAEAGTGNVIFVLIFSKFFAGIPQELSDAADIDGCNFLQKYIRVMLPLAKPVVSTVVIMQFV